MRAAEKIPTLERPSFARTVHLDEVDAAQARDCLVEALGQAGFGVLAEIDLAEILRRRLDVHIEPHYVLEVCRPDLARRALAVSADASLLMPCKIGVWKEGAGAAVGVLPARRVVAALGREHLDAVAAEADERLEQVLEAVQATAPGAPKRPRPAPARPLVLDDFDRSALAEAVRGRMKALLAEAAGTESHDLQHALARDIAQLEGIVRKMALETGDDEPDDCGSEVS